MPQATATSNNQSSKKELPKGDILVLLVGINKYRNAKNLSGCMKDLNRVAAFLKKRFLSEETLTGEKEGPITAYSMSAESAYANLKIYRLEDEQATYRNIIDAFRSFLRPAGAADKVWFHFSGHGIEAPTAKAFEFLENNKDQCLMCHDCAPNADGLHKNMLADKEIAVLLEEIAEGDNGTPHILVTMDCCHSGGATRDSSVGEEILIRGEEMPENAIQRDLASYLDGHYARMEEILVPKAPHTVLTACSNLELAGEQDGGYFTNGLMDTLERVGGKVSYADLLIQARHAVKQKRAVQTPKFEVFGHAKSYARFLEGTPENSADKYEIYYEEGWRIRCGRIQGLPAKTELNAIIQAGGLVEIEIHSTDQPNLVTAKAQLKDIGPEYSPLTITSGQLQTDETVYFGVFNYFPAPPAYAWINLSGEAKKILLEAEKNSGMTKARHIYLLTEPKAATPHQLSISMEGSQYLLTDDLTQQTAKAADTDALFDALLKMVNFHRLLALNNENAKLLANVDLVVDLVGKEEVPIVGATKASALGQEITITATLDNSFQGDYTDNRIFNLYPKVTIKNSSESLYVYLYSLWSDYSIAVEEEKRSAGLIDYAKFGSWGLDAGENKSTVYFKAIISPNPFDSFQLTQDGIIDPEAATRGRTRGVVMKSRVHFKDWCAITLKITVIRG